MSHDRGCFKCHDDPPYTYCKDANCPKLDRGYYSHEASEKRESARIAALKRADDEMRRQSLMFWREP